VYIKTDTHIKTDIYIKPDIYIKTDTYFKTDIYIKIGVYQNWHTSINCLKPLQIKRNDNCELNMDF
jgi:hypothetical protein